MQRSLRPTNIEKLIAVLLREARDLLGQPDNDFTWSSWKNAGEAIAELDSLVARLASDDLAKREEIAVLFAPTGPIQEVSVSSGWGQEFLSLANRFDAAIENAYGSRLLAWIYGFWR